MFEPLALRTEASSSELAFAERWQQALAAVRRGERSAAHDLLRAAAALRPGDKLAAIWQERLADPAFDGVFHLDNK